MVSITVFQEIAQIVAQKQLRLDPEHEQLIEYRRRLVEGTSLDDIKILKLRAYHRAMDKLKAENAELGKPEVRRQLMEMYGVPLDKVPQVEDFSASIVLALKIRLLSMITLYGVLIDLIIL